MKDLAGKRVQQMNAPVGLAKNTGLSSSKLAVPTATEFVGNTGTDEAQETAANPQIAAPIGFKAFSWGAFFISPFPRARMARKA